MNKYSYNPLNVILTMQDQLRYLKSCYDRCDRYIQQMRFSDNMKSSPMEISLYVKLRSAIHETLTALDDIETCRRHLYDE